MFNNVYQGKKVFVTGDTGFKGSWLCLWLKSLGADVHGFANGIPTTPSLFEDAKLDEQIKHHSGDIRSFEDISSILNKVQPDIVFHLAAEAIVRTCFDNPRLAFETNTLGTVNILEAVRHVASIKSAVFITSDKCYENVEWEYGYREDDRLGGKDPYSASKACAEIAFSTYFRSYLSELDCHVATTRAGNVIGGGDWAKDRIIPDAIKAWMNDEELYVRSPWATRPWQHVLEPLSGYLNLGAELFLRSENLNGESFNFGPNGESNYSVQTLIEEMKKTWTTGKFDYNKTEMPKNEATLLKLNIDRALARLNWRPTFNFQETVNFTADWYKNYQSKDQNISEFTINQISKYCELAKENKIQWTR